jgi:putative ABC transport system substrate-binding protein
MRRRKFIALFGGASALWLLAARAQQSMPVVGFLGSGSAAGAAPEIAAFRRGLGEIGYIEGKNVAFQYRWGEGQNSRLAALATDLVRRQVAVIVTTGGTPPALAAKAATSSIPIVFGVGTDPIAFGLVASLNKPGGNLTGVTTLFDEVAPKRLALLLELVPSAKIVGLLVNPSNPNSETQSKDLRQAVDKLGLELHVLNAKTDSDLEAAFAIMTQKRVEALLIGGDGFLENRRERIAELAAREAIPTISFERGFPTAGGLMSYGGSLADTYRLIGVDAGRILKGEKPADLPVQQSTKLELVINLKTAKTLDLPVPPTLLARVDEVIE